MSDQRKILVIGPSWVGDMVMAQSLFMILQDQHPAAQISVLAPSWSSPILERMPQVADNVDLPFAHGQFDLRGRWRFGRSLAQRRFHQAIVLPNSWKSAVIPLAARIPQRTGWRGEYRYGLLNDIRLLDKLRYRRTVERFVALGLPAESVLPPIPKPRLQIAPQAREQALRRFGLDTGLPVLALCPGAEFGPAKQWPAEYYAQLASQQSRLGWQVWLFGSANDQAVARQIASHGGQVFDLTGRTTLAEAIDLLSCARAVVSNDSGLMHVAAALHRPLLALYGSSDPAFTPPLSESSRVLSLELECSPCFKRTCPLGHLNCLRQMSVERVYEELQRLVSEVPAAETPV